MKKNIVWWPAIKNSDHNEKYGGYDYFKYSRKTWEYWCKKNNCLFIPFEIPVEKDLNKFRVNWQKAIFVFDELDRMGVEYDQIALVDSSFMIRWDAPNFFELTNHEFTVTRDMDNMRWIYESIQGYKNIFNGFELDKELPNFDKNYTLAQRSAKLGFTRRKDMPVISNNDVRLLQKRLLN